MNKTQSIEDLFGELIELSTQAERDAYIDHVCGDDRDLRERLLSLLESHQAAGSFLDEADVDTSTDGLSDSEQISQQIGPYKLLQKIGEGGMGAVYMAEQKQPVKRRVALKIIKPGMDSRQVIARFEAERQALAMMDHPNIAKVLEAGTTRDGRPYFVMELVKGIPITDFCDRHKLSPEDRQRLFIDVCSAVQHAHQKGIIHRDLKPSNVLVAKFDDTPVPKVIDFGVAKATNQELTERTMFTQFGQIVGTLEYMSPEQAQFNQLDIDTRSDIYSLGVLLYELLTGETPFDRDRLRNAALDEVLRIIREEEPPKPSVKLRSSQTLAAVAENRQLEPKRLGGLIQGDLDWIVMKALDKDRSRRYDSATRFADDLRGYMNHELVVARPPSTWNQCQKLYRRNRVLCNSAAVTFIGLCAGLALALVGMQSASAAKAKVEDKNNQLFSKNQELSETKEQLQLSLESVAENAIELGLHHALNGNREQMEDALAVADRAKVDSDRIGLIRAGLSVYGGDAKYDRVIKDLEAMIARSPQENVGAKSLLAIACLWSGKDLSRHTALVKELQPLVPAILAGERIDPEARLFLAQAAGLHRSDWYIRLVRPVAERTNSPVARLMLAQALADKAFDIHDSKSAIESYQNATAARLALPSSFMARALHVGTSHVAWRFAADGNESFYLSEALRVSREIDMNAGRVDAYLTAQFFAQTNDPERITIDWTQLRKGLFDSDTSGRVFAHSPEQFRDLLDILESRQGDGDGQWKLALFILSAVDRTRHAANRQRIGKLDLSEEQVIQLDPRVGALMATLMMDGRASSDATAIATALGPKPIPYNRLRPIGLAEYVLGDMPEPEFLDKNRSSLCRRGLSELFVALAYIGDRNREKAIQHLNRAIEANHAEAFPGFATGLRDRLVTNDPLVEWIR